MGPGENEQGFSEQTGDINGSDTGLADQTYGTGDYGVGDAASRDSSIAKEEQQENGSNELKYNTDEYSVAPTSDQSEDTPSMPYDVMGVSSARGTTTITFHLENNQSTDLVNVIVTDLGTGQQVNGTYILNRDDSVDIEIFADSSGKGSARWDFWTTNGSIRSNKNQSGISEGDTCTLG